MEQTMTAPPRCLYVFGTFDVRNYGDLLFPLIARHRLEPFGYLVRPVSPTDANTGWADCMPARGIAQLTSTRPAAHGVLIGGGNIVHRRAVKLDDYQLPGVRDWGYLALWFGASLFAALRNVPIAWNAPGVPEDLAAGDAPLLAGAIGLADYLSVRDASSAAFLAAAGARAEVVPDSALDIAAMWPRDTLRPDFEALLGRHGAREGAFAAIHVKQRSLDADGLPALAARIDAFASATALVPILLPIGPCHGDDVTALRLSRLMRADHVTVARPRGLREIAAAIAWSRIYVGASLHGLVTSFAYGTPGLLVARPDLAKFAGFLAHTGRGADRVESWDAALAEAPGRLTAECGQGPSPGPALRARLDAHWAAIAAALADPRVKFADRARFLNTVVADRLATLGPGWLLDDLVVRQTPRRPAPAPPGVAP